MEQLEAGQNCIFFSILIYLCQ